MDRRKPGRRRTGNCRASVGRRHGAIWPHHVSVLRWIAGQRRSMADARRGCCFTACNCRPRRLAASPIQGFAGENPAPVDPSRGRGARSFRRSLFSVVECEPIRPGVAAARPASSAGIAIALRAFRGELARCHRPAAGGRCGDNHAIRRRWRCLWPSLPLAPGTPRVRRNTPHSGGRLRACRPHAFKRSLRPNPAGGPIDRTMNALGAGLCRRTASKARRCRCPASLRNRKTPSGQRCHICRTQAGLLRM